jgi:peptidoglycan-N-acetylglucosamine deacetylase
MTGPSPRRPDAASSSVANTHGGDIRHPRRYRLTPGLSLWILLKFVSVLVWFSGHHTAALLIYFVWDPWLFLQVLVPRLGGFGPVASRFASDAREVWLTIDDGPDPVTTPKILDLLDRHGARATFFVIGQHVENHPELAREIVRRGHMLANHTDTHPCFSFWIAGPTRTAGEIDRCNRRITELGLIEALYFRAPVGIKNGFIAPALARRGMHYVAWSARGFDCTTEATLAASRVVRGIRPGAIVLLHEGKGDLGRVRVIETVLQHMHREGFKAVIPAVHSLKC